MSNLLQTESIWGIAMFATSVVLGPMFYRFYRRQPAPGFLQNELAAEMLLLGYFILSVTSIVALIDGVM
ncbi:MAG: hypothetical protein GC191_19355 [Azospirillum sp.]|nr:hypothetical protein [Azospirillum sp.]